MADRPTPDKAQTDAAGTNSSARVLAIREALIAAAGWAGYRSYRLGGEILSVILALGIAILFFASGLLARQSADLSALRPTVQTWFSQSFDGARTELGKLELRWNPSDDTVSFTASDVVVYDRGDTVVQTLPLLRATTTKADILNRQASLRDVEIIGGEVTWRQSEDGLVVAGLGTPETVGGFGPIYRGRQGASETTAIDWLDEFRSVTLSGSRVYIVNPRQGVDLVLDVDTLSGFRNGQQTRLSIDAHLAVADGQDDTGVLSLNLQSDDGLETISVDLETDDLRPSRIVSESGQLSTLNSVDVPLDATLNAIYSRQDGLQSATLDLSVGPGTVGPFGVERDVRSARFAAQLNPGDEIMTVETLLIEADRLSLSGAGIIREIGRIHDGDIGTSPKFDLKLADTRLDMTPILAEPLSMRAVDAVGEVDLNSRSLDFEQLFLRFDDFALSLQARLEAGDTGPTLLRLEGQSETPLNAQNLLALWPVNAADGARRWIDRSVLDGVVDDVKFRVALDEDFFADPKLTRDRLELDFNVRNGVVRYISTMDPLTHASGSGRIDGNRFGFVLERGQINAIELVGGDVDIPRLTPKGGDILITAQGRGDAQSLLSLINQPPFQYMDRYGVDPSGFSGDADITLSVKRPLLEYFDEDRIEYSVEGTFTDASAPFSFGDYGLTNADVSIRGGKDGLFVEGPANLGPWRAELMWQERYGQNGEPTRYRIRGPMDQKTLDGFGFGLRELFGGEIDVDIEASGRGLEVSEATLDLNLEQAELSFGEVWSKAVGEPAQLQADLIRSDTALQIDRLRLQSDEMDLTGRAEFSPNLALRELRLDPVRIGDLIDGRLTLARDDAGQRLSLDASGRRLDLTYWVQQSVRNAGQGAASLPLALDAAFDEIVLSPDYSLRSAAITYRHDGQAVERLSMQGARPSGDFSVRLEPNADDASRSATLQIPDMSEALAGIIELESTRDGTLLLKAELPPSGTDGPILGQALITDFTVQNAPFLAQILSLASLTGIVDTLSGGGLGFDELALDFGFQDRVLSVRDATVRGPAIGMTGEGDIDLQGRAIDFSGTLVPAYTANSLLGDIPIIGDIFVGKEGEGVFAVNYAIRGPFSGAQISINPLSALTPGFIRGIFRNSRDDLPDDVTEAMEAVQTLPESPEPEAAIDEPEPSDSPN